MINPYAGVNWSSCQRISSGSHIHCTTDEQLETVCNKNGFKHLALSNYYPSKPYYPLAEHFSNIPSGTIGSPNAEHHNLIIDGELTWNNHINGLGSTWASGSAKNENPVGVNDTWENAFTRILENLQYKDGGGITINHPVWSNLDIETAKRFLDFDERVLGIEIFNHTSETDTGTGWALDYWDSILKSGRRAWGFCAPDHAAKAYDAQGRNILLVESFTEKDCLEAYRKGAFYGKINNTDLAFLNIELTGITLSVKTNHATNINLVVDGVLTSYDGAELSVAIPNATTYVRVEAHTSADSIYANPIIFKNHNKKQKASNFLLWY